MTKMRSRAVVLAGAFMVMVISPQWRGGTVAEAAGGSMAAQAKSGPRAAVSNALGQLEQGVEKSFDGTLVPYLMNLPVEVGSVRLTRCLVSGRIFYYVQFGKDGSREAQAGADSASPSMDDSVWLTVMIGKVPQEGAGMEFILPEVLYYSLDGPSFKGIVSVSEFNQRLADFRKAIDLAEARLKSEVRSTLAEIERWLESPAGPAPLPNRELVALQELRWFNVQLFGS